MEKACRAVCESGFRPLNMAAALNIPEICAILVENDAQINAPSPFGRALDLAMVWTLAFCGRKSYRVALPSRKRRNKTLEILVSSGATLSTYPVFEKSVFSLTCTLCDLYRDFTALTKLLTLGAVPTSSDRAVLARNLDEYIEDRNSSKDVGPLEESSLELVQYLAHSKLEETYWGRQLGSLVWNWALRMGFDYAKRSSLVDSRISLSKEALTIKAAIAVRDNDVEVLAQCLADDRLDKDGMWGDHGGTLLHLAARGSSIEAMALLPDVGCDPYAYDDGGLTPLHVGVDFRWGVETVELYHSRGLSLLRTDTQGRTIWHAWAMVRPQPPRFLEATQNLDCVSVDRAMLMRTVKGDTPLTLVLEMVSLEYEISTRLIAYCANIPGFWKKHPPVLGTAAALSSEKVLKRLLDAGAYPNAVEHGNFTPLHLLTAQTEAGCAKLLKAMYPDACEIRYRGKYPVELYLEDVLSTPTRWYHAFTAVQLEEVVKELTNERLLPELWRFICDIFPTWHKSNNSTLREHLLILLRLGINLGAPIAYEDWSGESSLVPLFAGLAHDGDNPMDLSFLANDDEELRSIIHSVIVKTEHLESAMESTAAVRFLRAVTNAGSSPLLELLLANGADIHQRADGLSAVEHMCQADTAIRLCRLPPGRTFISTVLDRANIERLNEPTPNEEGFGLLHRLATSANPYSILWLIKDLVKRGLDVNAISGLESGRRSVLIHHVNSLSFQCVEALLELGADPTAVIPDAYAMDAPQAAMYNGRLYLLEALLAHSSGSAGTAGPSLDWTRWRSMEVRILGNAPRYTHVFANPFHMAAMAGHTECLKFYLDHGLVSHIDTPSRGGHTALHFAALSNAVPVIDLLTSRGASCMAMAEDGNTPLHYAARNGHFTAVEALLRRGATESLDVLALSPRMHAARIGFRDVVRLLEDTLGSSQAAEEQVPEAGQLNLSVRQISQLANALGQAIMARDLGECKRLLAAGCPVDVAMPPCGSCSPLICSILTANVDIVDCFLDHGASIIKPTCPEHGGADDLSAVELAVGIDRLNPILPKIICMYLDEGGDLVFGNDFPLHHAVAAQNTKGLKILLRVIDSNVEKIRYVLLICAFSGGCCLVRPDVYPLTQNSRLSGMTEDEVLSHIFNRRWPCSVAPLGAPGKGSHKPELTPLHVAALKGDSWAVSMLEYMGACPDKPSTDGFAPLVDSNHDTGIELLKRGAAPTGLYRALSPLPVVVWNWESAFSKAFSWCFAKDSIGGKLDMSVFLQLSTLWSPLACRDVPTDLRDIPRLAGAGYDMTVEDCSGRSMMHCLVCRKTTADFLLEHPDGYGLDKVTSFPWHLYWRPFGSIVFLRSKFGAFRNRLGHERFVELLSLQPARGWSPLCRAASLNLVDIMENCLTMGAELDFEGCPLGSALVIAAVCGSVEAVKLLVWRGAALQYTGNTGPVNVLTHVQSEVIRRWLVVGRFTEQGKITATEAESTAARPMAPRGGVAQARLVLIGKRQKSPLESCLEYASRLAEMRKSWHSNVVPAPEGLVYPTSILPRSELS
jgi:ankyrin repeat protein